jgi:glycosyltransferase involved in cell wall biosynthesis
LEHYSAIKGAKRAPLSSDEIKYLNSLVELDTDHKITRAASFFLEDHFGSTVRNELLSETCYDQLVYWWSVEESRRLFVEDCLVPKDHIHQLQRIQIESTDVDYPISTFIKTFISKNAVFNGLSVNKTDHRKLIYFTIMLYALRLPHILRYLPERWIENILWARVNGKTIFEEKMILVFGDASKLTSEIYAARMGLLGSDNQRERSAPSEIEAGRIFAATLPRPDRAMNDIQIIGPFGRILGLGHSCTILSRLIGKLGYSVNLVDFDLENNSPINCSAEIKISPLASARINILHLNAEIIPAAIAYMPDVFTNAFNIAFCYWELDSPADCQLLGLMLPDEIWVASAFTARAFGPYCRSLINVGTTYDVGPRIGHTAARKLFQSYNITDTDFVFLNVSDALSGVQRKNPMAAIRAFTAAFPENKQVKLIIKTHNVKHSASPNWRNVWKSIAEVAAADSRIILIDETFSRAKHLALIEASDCFVSLHRSEGLGLGLMEAFILGVPVMTTAYSGVLEFCNNDNAWLIDYDEILLNASDYAFVKPGHKWANPNPVSAITAMLEIYSDTSKRTRLAKNGRRYLEENFSPEIIAGRIHSRLCEILGK